MGNVGASTRESDGDAATDGLWARICGGYSPVD